MTPIDPRLWSIGRVDLSGERGVVHDHESGVRVIETSEAVSVSYIPAQYRRPNAPHPIEHERPSDRQVEMVRLSFGIEKWIEDHDIGSAIARYLVRPG